MWTSPLLLALLFAGLPADRPFWHVQERTGNIQLDGFLDDWEGVPALVLSPDSGNVHVEGEFGDGDLDVQVQMLWDRDHLYLAVHWEDDVWDLEEVTRRNAIWIGPGNLRRDRMRLFDFMRLELRYSNNQFTYWLTPRMDGEGPFGWHRLLEGLARSETATAPPRMTSRQHNGLATLEIQLSWRDLRIRPRRGTTLEATLTVVDSDLPGTSLEAKLDRIKSMEWTGLLLLRD